MPERGNSLSDDIASQLARIDATHYAAGRRGLVPLPDSTHWNLEAMLRGAIDGDRRTTVALVGLAALKQADMHAGILVFADLYDDIWHTADAFLA
jgi:hypothetical protein